MVSQTNDMRYALIASLLLILVGASCTKQTTIKTSDTPTSTTNTTTNTNAATSPNRAVPTFVTPKKSAHYESNTPAHGAILAAVPQGVVINFNFDLLTTSSIAIGQDGQEYGRGATTVDGNKLTLRRPMDPAAPDGTYTVSYNACWPDGSCHDGSFQFALDRSRASSYRDLRRQPDVTVRMKDIAFAPMDLLISKGTGVTWVNDDGVEHYVNTDAHPAHTYYPGQNSKALKTGERFTLPFDTPGIYPYHCSAHADTMTGSIIVE